MKLKYYLRGLGIGILITTIIFIIGIHVNQDQMFSDEEVIRRAKALGMVMDETDGKTINELDKDKKQDSESKDQKDSQKEDSKESKSDNKDKQEQAKDDQTKNDQTKADAESEKTQDSDAAAAQKQTVEQVEVSILPGEYSDTISQKLLDAGLIDDKAAFSKYINDTNVDNLIRFILQKKLADIHPLITVFGVVIGLSLFGFMGIIFGPLLLSLFLLCIDIFKKSYLDK